MTEVATLVFAAPSVTVAIDLPANDRRPGIFAVTIVNLGAANADLGDISVATGAGFPIEPGQTLTINIPAGDVIYAASPGTELAVMSPHAQ